MFMKRIAVFLFFLQFSFFTLRSQTMSEVFQSMPDSILPLLTERNRHDMVDFLSNTMEAKVRNRLNDYVKLDTLTDDYLRLTLSKSSMREIKLLQAKDNSPVVCLIQTVLTPVPDSSVRFYSADWQPLAGIEFPKPATPTFFSEVPDSLSREVGLAQRSIDDLRFVKVTTVPGEAVFTLTLSPAELERDAKELVSRFIRVLRYRWNGSRFVSEQS